MRVDLECHEPHLLQVVHDALHILAISAQVAGEPRHGLGAVGGDDAPPGFPPGAGGSHATGWARSVSTTAPRTCHRELVNPSRATILSPAITRRPFSLKTSRMRP